MNIHARHAIKVFATIAMREWNAWDRLAKEFTQWFLGKKALVSPPPKKKKQKQLPYAHHLVWAKENLPALLISEL